MAKRKKTWVERMDFTHLADDCELIDYLEFAVYKTCKRLGWDYSRARESDSFRKLEAWLPDNTSSTPKRLMATWAEGMIASVNVFIDTQHGGKLHGEAMPILGSFSKEERQEADIFLEALDRETRSMMQEWAAKHGGAVLPAEVTPQINAAQLPEKSAGTFTVEHGKPGAKPIRLYDQAFAMLKDKTPMNKAREWYFEQAGIKEPSAHDRNAFNQAMRTRRKKTTKTATKKTTK